MSSVQPSTRRWLRAGVAMSATAFVAFAALPADAGPDQRNNNTSAKLREAVTTAGVMEHARVLQDIADANGTTRVSGTSGYDDSVDYAMEVFRNAGYDVRRQDFTFQTFIERPGTLLRQVEPAPAADLATRIMSYSGSGDVTAAATAVPSVGCDSADFAGFPTGNVALVSRGGCTFATKATNAENAGASAVVIYNNTSGELNGTLGADFTGDIPAVSTTQALGQQLVATDGLVLRVKTDTFRGQATTSNVLAESKFGDPDNVVMAGAHLDSVSAGPGINDNGTGSASILEVAEQMTKVEPTNKVRFALWGAEESGLVGSHHYVDDLVENNPEELERIALYLNFDMVGSPNYSRFVYDGDNSAFPVGTGSAKGPEGSAQIEDMFHDYFESVGQASAETPFSGRSDYGPFIAAGVDIPSGGLFTGAEGVKTPEQAEVFGGLAGVAYDPCYHQACDALAQDFGSDTAKAALYDDLAAVYDLEGNVNLAAVGEMADAVAHAVITYAFNTQTVTGGGFGKPVTPPGQAVDGAPGGAMDDSGGGLHPEHEHDEAVM
ncbi:MAG TPA: M28 family metallopeptidase [Nocardioidaceae bacterium]|nr:M28 family metallopeptidase [Nocardioidaceae bacterium]